MTFETQVVPAAPEAHVTPLLILVVPQGAAPASLAALDKASGGAIGRCYAAGDFAGKKDESAVLYPEGSRPRLMLVGIGNPEDRRTAIRRAAAIGAKRARTVGVPSAALFVTPEALGTLSAKELGQLVAEGVAMGGWHFAELKQPPEDKKPPFERMELLVTSDAGAATEGHQIGAAVAAGHLFCRGLQVLPGNHLPPRKLAEAAAELAKRHGLTVSILDKAGIEKEGMGALLAVAQGSVEEPRFIALEYPGAEGKPVVLVGKGVSFDTGGISIKPAQGMEDM
ncbi:MAG TPA: M17 family peptidase N-terminal domain-containing protein, partial [Gemmatimonadales bacterium]|nr:M17 family peptidase N-terminal domain-containing protein [Gemmatimonadales bacterium]